jgi:serine/threonine protein kinase, bacterial
MSQQDKSWTRGEIFSAIGLLLSATGLTIALISASTNKDIRCSIAHIECNKPQPVTVVQPSNESKVSQHNKPESIKKIPESSSPQRDNVDLNTDKLVARKDTDAKSVIYSYYQEINSRNYNAAWNRLPTSTQENKNIHPNGQKDFISFFESVREVQVLKMSILESTKTSAIINAKFTYNMKSGNKAPISLKFKVYRENIDKDWIIEEVKKA